MYSIPIPHQSIELMEKQAIKFAKSNVADSSSLPRILERKTPMLYTSSIRPICSALMIFFTVGTSSEKNAKVTSIKGSDAAKKTHNRSTPVPSSEKFIPKNPAVKVNGR